MQLKPKTLNWKANEWGLGKKKAIFGWPPASSEHFCKISKLRKTKSLQFKVTGDVVSKLIWKVHERNKKCWICQLKNANEHFQTELIIFHIYFQKMFSENGFFWTCSSEVDSEYKRAKLLRSGEGGYFLSTLYHQKPQKGTTSKLPAYRTFTVVLLRGIALDYVPESRNWGQRAKTG